MARSPDWDNTSKIPNHILSEAYRLHAAGDRDAAHQACLEAIGSDPLNVDAWRLRSELALSPLERLTCLSQLHALGAGDPSAEIETHRLMSEALASDPYLEYIGESEQVYRTRDRSGQVILAPKYRRTVDPSAGEPSTRVKLAYRLLRWATLGLIPVGLGTLILAPLASVSAYSALRAASVRTDQRRALVCMALSTALFMVALPLVFLFFLHW